MEASKSINLVASLIVGSTFLFSGAIKLNDPLGFSYKIEEYLRVLASKMMGHVSFLLPYTLALAVGVATLEAGLGIALLVHWQRYWILRILLLLTLFFTGLTLYTATSSRIASCGCFGDFLNLTPWQSFIKSVFLLVLLIGIWWQTDKGTTTSLQGYYWVATAVVISLGISWYSIHHLPLLDLGPYKLGRNLAQFVQPRLPLRYVYTVEKDGQILELDHYPKETGYKFLSARLLNPEDVPEATNLSIWQRDIDCTQTLLNGHKLLIIVQCSEAITATTFHKLQTMVQQLPQELQPILLTPDEQGKTIANGLQLPLYTTQLLLLKAMLRAPLGLVYLQKGIVVGKWHYRDLEQAQKILCN